ncbi:Hypothetical predicted protein [Cloeon dipterum]|uniref:Uncharacterized protein n=1 Tax=Cloeon dipterum TaxID=197152 RepID=A0A8S1CVF6_9INSE|nr:Hypothetical predicted protein [Cloeon dipterum]
MLVTARMKIWKVLPELDIAVDIQSSGLTVEDFLEDDFSSIRHLEFFYHETIWNNLKTSKLPTQLESLNMHLADRKGIAALLLQFGASLRKLSLNEVGAHGVDLKRVSELCPKLRVLQLRSVSLVENSHQQANFRRLEELVWDDVDSGVDGSLAAFLSSVPNLEKLEVNCQQFPLDDLRHMIKLIIEKNVLSSLQSLRWNFNRLTPQNIFIQLAAVIKVASAMLPKLKGLNLTYESHPVLKVVSIAAQMFGI